MRNYLLSDIFLKILFLISDQNFHRKIYETISIQFFHTPFPASRMLKSKRIAKEYMFSVSRAIECQLFGSVNFSHVARSTISAEKSEKELEMIQIEILQYFSSQPFSTAVMSV